MGSFCLSCVYRYTSIAHALESIEDADDVIDFVSACLAWDTRERMTAVQGIAHPWIRPRRLNSSRVRENRRSINNLQ